MIYTTADLHLGHGNIIKYCNRPFENVEEMDNALIQNWNNVVGDKDEVYVLGDFAFNNPAEYAKQLNGRKYLIIGNHDVKKLKYLESSKIFEWIRSYHELNWNKHCIILFHYALRTWNRAHHGSWHLYGHSHGGMPSHGKSFDVGVDCWNYKPISIEQVAQKMEKLGNAQK